eukprot:207341_1
MSLYPDKVTELLIDLMHVKKSKYVYDISAPIKYLPSKQMKRLLSYSKGTRYYVTVLREYMKKLMPNELSLFIGQSWSKNEVIPIELKWEYMQILYKETRHILHDNDDEDVYVDVLFHYIIFCEEHYYRLGLVHPYDIDIVLQFLQSRNQKKKKKMSVHLPWARFADVSRFNFVAALQLMQRFMEFLNTQSGNEYYATHQNNAKYFFESAQKNERVNITHAFMDRYEYLSISMLQNAERTARLREGYDIQQCVSSSGSIDDVEDARTLIQFNVHKNPSYFTLDAEEISVFVHVRNVNDILVKWFEINTKSYYRDNNKPISTALNLDGLSASYEWNIAHKDLGLKTKYHEKEIMIPFPTQWLHKRGVYFLDLLSNGIHSRAIINIGSIKYINTICEAGHLFTLLDENNQIIANASILLNKHVYKTSSDAHSILIPFTNKPNLQHIILQRADDPTFNVLSTFQHQSESYEFECGFYMDREQILSQRKALLMVRCGLFLNGKQNRISLAVLQNTQLSIYLSSNEDTMDINKEYDEFRLFDDKESTVLIDIPNQIELFVIKLSTQIEKTSSTNPWDNVQDFTKEHHFVVNEIVHTVRIAQLFLIPQMDNHYMIALYGRNGEPIYNQKLNIVLFVRSRTRGSTAIAINDLYTDKYGRIYLPNLNKDLVRLRVIARDLQIEKAWDLNTRQDFVKVPHRVHILSGESVSIPYVNTAANDGVFALFDHYYTTRYDANHLQYNAKTSQIVISDLASGKYNLKILDLEYTVQIYVVRKGMLFNLDDRWFNVYKQQMTLLSTNNALQIETVEPDEDNEFLTIKLNGVNERTRVHVIGTHLLPAFDITHSLYRDVSALNGKRSFLYKDINYYLDQREIDEEYRYVLEREQSPKYPGNALKRPSFLVKPFELGDTVTETQDAAKGGQFHAQDVGGGRQFDADDHHDYEESAFIGQEDWNDDSNIDFLSENGSIILYNLIPNADNIVTVNIKSMYQTNQNFIKIIALDEDQRVTKTHCLSHRHTTEYNIPVLNQYVDNRMMVGLNPMYEYIDAYDIITLNQPPYHYTINDFKSSQMEIYPTFDAIFDLMRTISQESQLSKWSFLKQWYAFNHTQKLQKYESFFSHELHFFLKKHDVPFFKEVCLIHIQSKLYKDFMDFYFLNDRDVLITYLDMPKLLRLNVLEQILLAHVFKNEPKYQSMLQYAQYHSCYDTFQYESLQVDRKRFNKIFVTASSPTTDPTTDPTPYPTTDPTLDPTFDPSTDPTTYPTEPPTSAPSGRRRMREDPRPRAPPKPSKRKSEYPRGGASYFGGYAKERARMKQQKYFEQVPKTKEYKETSFWNLKYKKDVIKLNSFWCDFAMWLLRDDEDKKDNAFLSQWFIITTSSVNEMLFALSLLDIPFTNRHNTIEFTHNNRKDWNNNVTLSTALPSFLFIKQLKKSAKHKTLDTKQAKSVLIYSHYFDPNDRYQEQKDSNSIRKEKFVESDAFIPGKVYGVSVILISVVSYEQRLNILTQIPTGSIPIGRYAFRTKTHTFSLDQYSVEKFEYLFYFPIIGTFQIYPIIVSYQSTQEIISSFHVNNEKNNQIMVRNPRKTSDKVTNIESWNDVSLHGNSNEVIQYLSTHNVHKISLSRIYYKLSQSLEFYDAILDLLRAKYIYDDVIWSFQMFWINDIMSQSQSLQTLNLESLKDRFAVLLEYISIQYTALDTNAFDPYYKSHHFVYDSMEHNKYDYKEYIPLINARKYVLGQKHNILNNKFKIQYEAFLLRCSYQSDSIRTLPIRELISATYYLLLQDRIDEAMRIYQIIKERTVNEMHGNPLYDYFIGYMSLYEYDDYHNIIDIISHITKRYSNVSLIESKRTLFNELDTLLQDITMDTAHRQTDLNVGSTDIYTNTRLDDEEFVQFEINSEDKQITVTSQNVNQFDVNLYTINMEVLFSMNPSLVLPSSQSLDSRSAVFSYIKPKQSVSVDVASGARDVNEMVETQVLIPQELRNENVFIQIITSTMIVSKPYNDHQLIIHIQENKGKLKVLRRDEKSTKLMFVNKAYVKVYARKVNNKYEFYKDGYTDIRGLFDYVSLSTADLDVTDKFVIFVKHMEYGCTVQEANPPTR